MTASDSDDIPQQVEEMLLPIRISLQRHIHNADKAAGIEPDDERFQTQIRYINTILNAFKHALLHETLYNGEPLHTAPRKVVDQVLNEVATTIHQATYKQVVQQTPETHQIFKATQLAEEHLLGPGTGFHMMVTEQIRLLTQLSRCRQAGGDNPSALAQTLNAFTERFERETGNYLPNMDEQDRKTFQTLISKVAKGMMDQNEPTYGFLAQQDADRNVCLLVDSLTHAAYAEKMEAIMPLFSKENLKQWLRWDKYHEKLTSNQPEGKTPVLPLVARTPALAPRPDAIILEPGIAEKLTPHTARRSGLH